MLNDQELMRRIEEKERELQMYDDNRKSKFKVSLRLRVKI